MPVSKVSLTASELEICKQLGIKPEQYASEKLKSHPSWATDFGQREEELRKELETLGVHRSRQPHDWLCTCMRCNTDLDCKSIAAETKNKAEYDKKVLEQRAILRKRGRNHEEKKKLFEHYMRVFDGDGPICSSLLDLGFFHHFPKNWKCKTINIERNDMQRCEHIVMRSFHGEAISHTVTDAELQNDPQKQGAARGFANAMRNFPQGKEETYGTVEKPTSMLDALAKQYTDALAKQMTNVASQTLNQTNAIAKDPFQAPIKQEGGMLPDRKPGEDARVYWGIDSAVQPKQEGGDISAIAGISLDGELT